MATSLSEVASGLGSKPLAEYDWWKHHLVFFVSLFFLIPMAATFFFGFSPLWSFFGVTGIVTVLVNWTLRIVVLVVFPVTWVGSLVGYYYDSKYVETLDSDWSPHWVLYTAVHLIPVIGALVAVPFYVLQRLRHVGLPLFG